MKKLFKIKNRNKIQNNYNKKIFKILKITKTYLKKNKNKLNN